MSAAARHVESQLAAARRELLRRARARESLHSFALSIEIPTVPSGPYGPLKPDEDLTGPASELMAAHHAAICATLQRTMDRPFGRCLIMAPPGSAKSMYTSVIAPAWEMGRKPGSRLIMTSYGAKLVEKQSGRVQDITRQPHYRELFAEAPTLTSEAAGEWGLSNGSECIATGIMGSVTGNRASGLIIDDPVAGREEADSEAHRQKTLDAYQDDLLTRLLPGAWVALIMTRWHEQDLAGSILPDDYKGESGMIRCKDGLMWEVLNIPAKCERTDDPLGRALGDYLWTDYYPVQHWQMHELAEGQEAARKWSSLYQQRPTNAGSGRFTRAHFDPYMYDPGELPLSMNFIGASDHAVTEGGNDFTEIGVCGMDCNSHIWFVDWYSKQTGDTGEAIDEILDRVQRWKAKMWFNEGGVIDKAITGPFNRRSRERLSLGEQVQTDRRSLPSMKDKVAKAMAFQARCSIGTVHFPRNAPWTEQVIQQLLALPTGRHDDKADVCGLIGRAIDQFHPTHKPPPVEPKGIKPFTVAWLEYEEPQRPAIRYR